MTYKLALNYEVHPNISPNIILDKGAPTHHLVLKSIEKRAFAIGPVIQIYFQDGTFQRLGCSPTDSSWNPVVLETPLMKDISNGYNELIIVAEDDKIQLRYLDTAFSNDNDFAPLVICHRPLYDTPIEYVIEPFDTTYYLQVYTITNEEKENVNMEN